MAAKEKVQKGDSGSGKGYISIVGIGPGGLAHLTARASAALASADVIVGYTRYVELIKDLTVGKEVFTSGMTFEVERCQKAVELAGAGAAVAVVSSGDAGIYGMAGLVMQLAAKGNLAALSIEVIPGVPAFVASAAILGAPLMHDFASISLSDLLTPWRKIEDRLIAAASADFVICLYNPKSSKRTEGLVRAVDIISGHRAASTPVGLVRNATREGEEAVLTTLGGIGQFYDKVDMLSIIIVGNSQTINQAGRMITPRGYEGV